MRQWFKFNGESSIRHEVLLLHPGHRTRGEQERDVYDVPFSDRYNVILYPHFKPYPRTLRIAFRESITDRIYDWLTGRGRLEISTDPYVYFMATAGGIKQAKLYERGWVEAEAELMVDPFAFIKSGDEPITCSQEMTLVNPGTWYAKPLYKVKGSGDGTIVVNGRTMALKGMTGALSIDCGRLTVYNDQINEGRKMIGDFLGFKPGENTLSYSGGITLLEVVPRWCEL